MSLASTTGVGDHGHYGWAAQWSPWGGPMAATERETGRRRAAWLISAFALLAAIGAAGALVARRKRASVDVSTPRVSVTANGMEYTVLGHGRKTILFIPGGPGSEIPTGGLARRGILAQLQPYAEAGYTVWQVCRRRNMPEGHTVADMADDYARFIRDELGGHVDIVIGESYGGMIAIYLAAEHAALIGRVVLALAAATITERGRELDLRWARARAEGRFGDAGAIALEYVLPGDEMAGLRRRLGPLVGRMFASSHTPPDDLIVEAEAEAAFDAQAVLGHIAVPVLLLCGDNDQFFTPDIVRETAAGIPDCTLVWFEGMGHVRAAMSGRLPREILAWIQ
ncbi:alpha/beta hydrolase [Agromyces sp. SYSU K20354]|uniref:alpha/beta fold hydrolase n=1 Tax=Agromyces cavernae TaxID=2898659 RepID=UPI001E36E902|nr:alpha/beta hydrolase [Agromyces cavernae]MCD2444157.1 alpha/beta hydrolase [Agromyces cavernae]